MTKRPSGPTVFLPMPPRRRIPLDDRSDTSSPSAQPVMTAAHNVIFQDADFWEEDFAVYGDPNSLTAPLPPKTKTVRRSRADKDALSTTAESVHVGTIRSFLHETLRGEPVCILTQAGRFRGELLDVGLHDLALRTDQGQMRYLALDGLLSVGYDRFATSLQTFKNA